MKQILEYLQLNNVSFTSFEHQSVGDPIEYSKVNGTKLSQQAKALFLKCRKRLGGEDTFVILTLPANKRADFKKLGEIIEGVKTISIAEEAVMKEFTKCNYGELPPLAGFWNLPLYMDKDLLLENEIYFNAASLCFSIKMKSEDLVLLENAKLI